VDEIRCLSVCFVGWGSGAGLFFSSHTNSCWGQLNKYCNLIYDFVCLRDKMMIKISLTYSTNKHSSSYEHFLLPRNSVISEPLQIYCEMTCVLNALST
jgi:hypothetical protein